MHKLQQPIQHFAAQPQSKMTKLVYPRLLLILVSLWMLSSCYDVQQASITHEYNNNQLTLSNANRSIQLSALETGAIQVEFLEGSQPQLKSFALKDNLTKKTASFQETEKAYLFEAEKLSAVIDKSSLEIAFYRNKELLTKQSPVWLITSSRGQPLNQLQFSLSEKEKLMGAGQRVLGMNRRGHRLPLYNRAHYGYTTHSEQMYYSLPLVISDKQYAVLFDNTASGFVDLGKTIQDKLIFEAESGRKAYVVFAENSYPQLVNQYVQVTGTQPLPPRWAFGNFSSRFGYKNQQQVLQTIDKFIQEDMPVDAIILDLYWFGNDIKGFMGNLAWDKTTFPEPEKMINQLNQQGIKTILVTEPFILSTSDRWQEAVDAKILMKNEQGQAKRFDFYFGNTGLIDIFDDNAKDWFSGIYSQLTQQGVAGVWGDLGEPEVHPDDGLHYVSDMQKSYTAKTLHNAYGHEWAKMVYQNLLADTPNQRPFVMMRSGFAGTQRYGMIPWTGDVSRSWDGLKPQVELSLQMGMQGLAYTHSDLGGFAGGEIFDKELYIRWLQYGVFQPVFRPHAQDNIAPEPIFHDQQTKDIVRHFLKLRYSMLPYLYSMAYQNSKTGMPLMRPMMMADTKPSANFDVNTQYYWGDSLLVAPVVEPGLNKMEVALPAGTWFDFWDGQKYQGDQQATIPVSLQTIPVLVKAGAFIPMIEPINNTKDYSSQKLKLHYYHDTNSKQGQYQMYEDDGVTPNNIANKNYELLNFTAESQDNQLVIALQRTGPGYQSMPKQREINLMIHGIESAPKSLSVGETKLQENNYHYNQSKKQIEFSFAWDHQKQKVTVTLN